eukprot:tig00000093_g3541.t1
MRRADCSHAPPELPSDPAAERSLADAWRGASRILVFGGAGLSTESGIPDFRSATGLWRQHPQTLCTLAYLRRSPRQFWAFYHCRIKTLWEVEPHEGHRALAELEAAGRVDLIVTQNVDGLHQAAGSRKVVELHGNLRTVSCMQCGQTADSRTVLPARELSEEEYKEGAYRCGEELLCRRPRCRGKLRPDDLLFGEDLPPGAWERAEEAARALRAGDLCVVVGSSLAVMPACLIPEIALESGASLAIINANPTPLDSRATWLLRGRAGAALSRLAKLVLAKDHGAAPGPSLGKEDGPNQQQPRAAEPAETSGAMTGAELENPDRPPTAKRARTEPPARTV